VSTFRSTGFSHCLQFEDKRGEELVVIFNFFTLWFKHCFQKSFQKKNMTSLELKFDSDGSPYRSFKTPKGEDMIMYYGPARIKGSRGLLGLTGCLGPSGLPDFGDDGTGQMMVKEKENKSKD
jgi:hypothetical protein